MTRYLSLINCRFILFQLLLLSWVASANTNCVYKIFSPEQLKQWHVRVSNRILSGIVENKIEDMSQKINFVIDSLILRNLTAESEIEILTLVFDQFKIDYFPWNYRSNLLSDGSYIFYSRRDIVISKTGDIFYGLNSSNHNVIHYRNPQTRTMGVAPNYPSMERWIVPNDRLHLHPEVLVSAP